MVSRARLGQWTTGSATFANLPIIGNSLLAQLLSKRPGRRDKKGSDDFPWDTAETRPVLREEVVEKGEDYWMDDRELAKNQAKDEAIKNRKVRIITLCSVKRGATTPMPVVFILLEMHDRESYISFFRVVHKRMLTLKRAHYIAGNGGGNIQGKAERGSGGTVQAKLDWFSIGGSYCACHHNNEVSRTSASTNNSDSRSLTGVVWKV